MRPGLGATQAGPIVGPPEGLCYVGPPEGLCYLCDKITIGFSIQTQDPPRKAATAMRACASSGTRKSIVSTSSHETAQAARGGNPAHGDLAERGDLINGLLSRSCCKRKIAQRSSHHRPRKLIIDVSTIVEWTAPCNPSTSLRPT